MAWIPRNKNTGVEYPPIDDATRAQWEADPNIKGKYTYTRTGEPAKTVSVKEAAPKKPVGVPDPETKKEE